LRDILSAVLTVQCCHLEQWHTNAIALKTELPEWKIWLNRKKSYQFKFWSHWNQSWI